MIQVEARAGLQEMAEKQDTKIYIGTSTGEENKHFLFETIYFQVFYFSTLTCTLIWSASAKIFLSDKMHTHRKGPFVQRILWGLCGMSGTTAATV